MRLGWKRKSCRQRKIKPRELAVTSDVGAKTVTRSS